MTDLEIQSKLLAYYKQHLEKMPKYNTWENISYLQSVNMEGGICSCAFFSFGIKICNKKWVRANITYSKTYWTYTPNMVSTIKEIKECLQYRIDILERLVASHQTA